MKSSAIKLPVIGVKFIYVVSHIVIMASTWASNLTPTETNRGKSMNIEVKVNILPWNEFIAEYKFPAEEQEKPVVIREPRVCLIPPIEVSFEPTSEPYIPPPSTTAVEGTPS